MCLYPRMIKNKRYEKTKKNGGNVPAVPDSRVLYVPRVCGNCMECRKKKARDWKVRLMEDIKEHTGAKFITLTFSNEKLQEIHQQLMTWYDTPWNLKGYELDNQIATHAMRMFNERYRKITGKALRHWTITELGHQGTENIHLHGIIWPGHHKNNKKYKGRPVTMEDIEQMWGNGFVWKYKIEKGIKVNYVNNRTVTYLTKYVTKVDELHKYYIPKTLTSPGIGKHYTDSTQSQRNKFKPQNTRTYYRTETGHKLALPTYWRNKIYTDEEREELWLQTMDKKEAYVCGEKVSTKNGNNELFELRKYYRKKNRRLGYGSYHVDMDRKEWEEKRREAKHGERGLKPHYGKNKYKDWKQKQYTPHEDWDEEIHWTELNYLLNRK